MIAEIFCFILGVLVASFIFKIFLNFLVRKKVEEELSKVKKKILERSRAVIKGKIAEQLVTILPEFPFNPADARFIGNPVDYIIFDGYTRVKDEGEGNIRIVFMEVKKGSGKLSRIEKKIKEAVERKRVDWVTLKL